MSSKSLLHIVNNDGMPASYKDVKDKSCLQRNIFKGLDVEKVPKNFPVFFKEK